MLYLGRLSQPSAVLEANTGLQFGAGSPQQNTLEALIPQQAAAGVVKDFGAGLDDLASAGNVPAPGAITDPINPLAAPNLSFDPTRSPRVLSSAAGNPSNDDSFKTVERGPQGQLGVLINKGEADALTGSGAEGVPNGTGLQDVRPTEQDAVNRALQNGAQDAAMIAFDGKRVLVMVDANGQHRFFDMSNPEQPIELKQQSQE